MNAINEERLFKQLPYFFDNQAGVLVELAQNACRAGATSLDIKVEGDILTVSDNGHGTDNPEALFCLAASDWSEDVEANQMPAGWGLFFLISISESIIFRSRFGSITLDCRAYLNCKTYRENLLSLVDRSGQIPEGLFVEAMLKTGIGVRLGHGGSLAWFPVEITVNGSRIERRSPDLDFAGYPIKTTYMGNRVWVNPRNIHIRQSDCAVVELIDHTCLFWYGIPIQHLRYGNWIAMEAKEGMPLTPVLPYRTGIQVDAKAETFAEFVRNKLIDYVKTTVNNCQEENGKCWGHRTEVIHLMRLAQALFSQEELDALDVFYVEIEDQYYRTEADRTVEYRIVRKGQEGFASEQVRFSINNKEADNLYGLVLPEGTVTQVLSSPRPSWLRIEEKEKIITVIPCADKPPEGEYFNWQEARITCDGGVLPVLALVEGSYDGTVYYQGNPDCFGQIEEAVFAVAVHDAEGDRYETQEEDYRRAVEKDITAITGTYRLSALLGGMWDLDIDPGTIRTIRIENGTMHIAKDDGEVTIKIAA